MQVWFKVALAASLSTVAHGTELDEPTSLILEVESTAPRPRGSPVASPPPTVQLAALTYDILVDGKMETAWTQAEPSSPRALVNSAPPEPAWSARALATPGGLAVFLHGVPAQSETVVAVDPDGGRMGWTAVRLDPEGPVTRTCAARPVDAVVPFPAEWNVYHRPCGPYTRAQAAHGPDGWELLLPWGTLGPTTDDLQIQWWTRTDDATASFDAAGVAREYAGGARKVSVEGQDGRRESIGVAWNRGAGRSTWTLAASGLAETEFWDWEAHYNGLVLARGTVELVPDARGNARASIDLALQAHTSTGMRARQSGTRPLARGAWAMPWALSERATVATPVHDGKLEIRFDQTTRDRTTALRFRSSTGEALHEENVTLPHGEGRLFVRVPDDWPDALEVTLDGLFPEPWIPVLRQGATARALEGE